MPIIIVVKVSYDEIIMQILMVDVKTDKLSCRGGQLVVLSTVWTEDGLVFAEMDGIFSKPSLCANS